LAFVKQQLVEYSPTFSQTRRDTTVHHKIHFTIVFASVEPKNSVATLNPTK